MSPTRTLHLFDSVAVAKVQSSTDNAAVQLTTPTGGDAYFQLLDTRARLVVGNAERLSITTSGNVGIGTLSPSAPLSVAGSTSGVRVNYWVDLNSSACGLGSIGQNVYLNQVDSTYKWANNHGSMGGSLIQLGVCNSSTWNDIVFLRASGTTGSIPTTANATASLTESMRIASTGNVGIGTATPQHLLHVAGTIGAEEVIVTSTGADYVFRPDYKLRPLAETAEFIKENHHLPGIPSEAEVKEKGLGLGEMQTRLLAKIEELTLQMIQADERDTRLAQENLELHNEIKQIRQAISAAGVLQAQK